MAVKGKGKQVAGKAPASTPSSSSAKRKKPASDSNDRRRKRRSGVLQFFDDVADDADYDDEDDKENEQDDEDMLFDDDDDDIELDISKKGKTESSYKGGRTYHHLPFFVKEEELSGDELEELIKERYGKGSEYVVNGEDPKEFDDDDVVVEHTKEDPSIWKVKCMAGREQHVVLCLMHKYADMQRLGTKMDIISAFSLEHVKGFVYIEADKAFDVYEACKGFFNMYSSKIGQVPRNDIPKLLSIRNKTCVIQKGTWVRMKHGNYKGDLGQVVDFDEARKKATVKLVPRIDLQAIAKKYGGGISLKQAAVPPPRLISSYELEHFRPHIEIRRDRDSGETFEVLDGMMLKDGYLYKKVSMASIVFWGVQPLKDELLKFTELRKDEEEDVSWLSSVYSVRKKKSSQASEQDNSSNQGSGFSLHDLVLFGRKAFGVIIDIGKDGTKVLKGDTDGQEVMTVKIQEIKSRCVDKMFTASDRHAKTIFINDNVKVLDGPLEGKEGTVRHMYRGTLFVYDENQEENSGIFCSKSDMCENTTPSKDFLRKGGNKASSSFAQSPVRIDEQEDNTCTFSRNRRSENQVFSVGQSLRIRKGPLKGYLCRVVAIYRSDVTVKLDSLGKTITVEEQLLSIPNIKREFSGDFPSDPFATQTTGSLSNGGEPATGTSSWGVGSSSWQALSSSSFSFAANNTEKEGDPWGSKLAPAVKDQDQGADPWDNKVSLPTQDNEQVADPWGSKVSLGSGDPGGSDPWGSKLESIAEEQEQSAVTWGSKATGASTEASADPWSSKVTPGNSSNSVKAVHGWAKASSTTGQQNSASDNKVGGSLDKDGDGWNRPSGASSSVQERADPWGSNLAPGDRAEQKQGSDAWAGKAAGASRVEEQKADPWGAKVAGSSKASEEQIADTWGTKVAGSSKADEGQKTDSWGAKVAGPSKGEEQKADPWGTKVAGASIGNEHKKVDPWGAKVVGSSRADEEKKSDPWGTKVDARDSSQSRDEEKKSDPWGTKVDVRDSSQSREAVDCWAKTSSTAGVQNSSWNKPASRDMEKDNWGAAKSSTKSALEHGSSWDKVQSAGEGLSGSDVGWGKPGISTKNDTDGWNSSKSFGADQGSDWKKADGDDANNFFQRNSWDNQQNDFQGGRGFGQGRGRGGNSWDSKPIEDGGQGFSSGGGGWNSNNGGAGSNVGQGNSWNSQNDFDGGGRGFGRGRGRFGGRGGRDEDNNQHGSGDHSGGGWGSSRGRGRGRFGGRGGKDEEDNQHVSGDYNSGGGWGSGRGRGRGRFGGRGGQDEEGNQHGSGDYNSGGGWGSGRGRGRGRSGDSGSFTDNFEGRGRGRGRGGQFQSSNRDSNQGNNFGGESFSSGPVSCSWGNDQFNSTWDQSKSYNTNEPAVVQKDGWGSWNSSSWDAGSSKQSSDWGKNDGIDRQSTPQKDFGGNHTSDWNQVKTRDHGVSKGGGGGMGGACDSAKESDGAGAGCHWGKVKPNNDEKQASDWNNSKKGGDDWNKPKPSLGEAGNWDKEKSFGGGKSTDWNQNSKLTLAVEDAGGSDGNWSRTRANSGRDQSYGWGTGDGGSWSKPKPSGGESSPWSNKNDWNGHGQGKINSFSGDNSSSVWGRNEGSGDQQGSGMGNSFSDRGRGRGRGGRNFSDGGRGGRNFSNGGRGRNFGDRGGRSSGWNGGGRGNDNNSECFSRSGNDGGWGGGNTTAPQQQEGDSGWSNTAPAAGGGGWGGWGKPGGSSGNAASGGKGGWE